MTPAVTLPAPGGSPSFLCAEGIQHGYRSRGGVFRRGPYTKVLDAIDLSVERGETLGIVGESGCGKSTLARLLLGLEIPDRGQVSLEGRAIGQFSHVALARRIQPVFQDPYSSLNPRRSVLAAVEHPLRVHGLGARAERRRRAEDILGRVGLPRRTFDSLPRNLSGGQRQRVSIARALVLEPEIIVCDEPTSALDVSIQAQILNLIAGLRRDLGLTCIFISHNLSVVAHMADRVGVMCEGRLVEIGPARELFATPRHPYTAALLASVLPPVAARELPRLPVRSARLGPMAEGCRLADRCLHAEADCRVVEPHLRPIEGVWAACHHPRGTVATGEGMTSRNDPHFAEDPGLKVSASQDQEIR